MTTSSKQSTLSSVLAALTLLGAIFRSAVLVLLLRDTINFESTVDLSIYAFLKVYLTIYLALAITSFLLIYAIVEEKHILIVPWLIVNLIRLVFEICCSIFLITNLRIIFPIILISPDLGQKLLYILTGNAFTYWIGTVIWNFYKIVKCESEVKQYQQNHLK